MLLDLKKPLVKRKDLSRTFFACGGELVLSMGENLLEMSRDRHIAI